jgi:protein-L-isoaspartate O-methyltransferase
VNVHHGDGGQFDAGAVGAIFVNAGATHPQAIWLDALREDPTLNVEISRKRGSESRVRSVRRGAHEPDDSCWLHAQGACLSMRSVAPNIAA